MPAALRACLFSATALGAIAVNPAPAAAAAQTQVYSFDIPVQDLGQALNRFARLSRQQVIFDPAAVSGRKSAPLVGSYTAHEAIERLIAKSGLVVRVGGSGIFIVQPEAAPPSGPPPDGPAPPAPAPAQESAPPPETGGPDIIVTAQRFEESIQDVPIAVSAFSGAALWDLKIEGGSELLRAIPNVSFSKSNFSMYNFAIRGIGTKAISASSDPAVAVSFNNTPLIRNRLFEQEFFDIERIEVLRGPQGTLYGRNATAGVVNIIPTRPGPEFEGRIRAEVGNYSSRRLNGMLNVPLGDTLGIRAAGAWTKRDGFDFNTFTRRRVNGRDLWSTRVEVAWEPTSNFRASLIWQHFEEDDDRARTGKQLCTNDPGPERVGNVATGTLRPILSQGCLPGSLYDDAAFGVPNGRSLAFIEVPATTILGRKFDPTRPRGVGERVDGLLPGDPFAGVTQSRNLREISTSYDPRFRAENDVVQLNLEIEPAPGLQFASQTAYAKDFFFSTQDYNRFVSNPIFSDSTQPLVDVLGRRFDPAVTPGPSPGGIFCDPQLGCSDRMVSADLSRSRNTQWAQEFRLNSKFDGPINFNIGALYLDFRSQDDYYVFNNLFTYIAQWFYDATGTPRIPNTPPCTLGFEGRECVYVDPNPIESLNNQGHNYFLSQNGVKIRSFGVFGELYWNIASDLKLTLGGRYTDDRKISDQVPSQLLLAGGIDNPFGPEFVGDLTGGRVNSGYPALPDIDQQWGEFTGRAVLDWQPSLTFTDDTLIYASVARGYKGGGANPPRVDFNPRIVQYQFLPQTFRPEFVNAFELGTKNVFDGGRLTLNANAFFYSYNDYQISQIVDRIAFNENFDATSMGLEFEADWRPSRAFRLNANLGYLKTRLANGSQSIDVMDRTQGDPDWVVLRPWLQVPSNCIAPRTFVERVLARPNALALRALCPGSTRIGTFDPNVPTRVNRFWQTYGFTYDPFAPYNPDTVGLNIDQGGSGAPNGGRGFFADLGGNELPNAPRWTFNIGAQYTFFIDEGDWELTFRGDYYRQSSSYARIYNTTFDRLRGWNNVNLAVTLARPASDLVYELYVKNLFNNAPITDFFLNSDDTGLTANVFTLDPKIIGFNVTMSF
jgi:iron complex outermembrane receptor protein